MKRYFVIAVVFLLMVFSGCKVNRKVASTTNVNLEQKDSTVVEKETTTVVTPKRDLQIFDVIRTTRDGSFKPIQRTFKDEASGNTVSYSIDETGVLEIKSIAPADTIQKTKETQIKANNSSVSIQEDKKVDFKGSIRLSEILSIVLGGITSVIPGLGMIKYFVIAVILLFILFFFRRKKSDNKTS
jgi:Flp pilus assembly protein TadB